MLHELICECNILLVIVDQYMAWSTIDLVYIQQTILFNNTTPGVLKPPWNWLELQVIQLP